MTSFGPGAAGPARALGREMRPRVTFGWAALREKLYCADRGLDDVCRELTKLALVHGLDDSPLADDTELRLGDVEGDELVLAWIEAARERVVETLRVPRALYDDIAADEAAWQELRQELTAGPYVDINRLLVPAADA